jgi:carboxymethylenebutenolidase
VNADRAAMTAALRQAKLVHDVRTFPGVNHAFFNDTGARHDPAQAASAYDAVLTWFARSLA